MPHSGYRSAHFQVHSVIDVDLLLEGFALCCKDVQNRRGPLHLGPAMAARVKCHLVQHPEGRF